MTEGRSGKSTLLGVTGSGKTYTIAQVIAQQNKPVLVLAPNKTLAAQLYEEFSQFFPENKVSSTTEKAPNCRPTTAEIIVAIKILCELRPLRVISLYI